MYISYTIPHSGMMTVLHYNKFCLGEITCKQTNIFVILGENIMYKILTIWGNIFHMTLCYTINFYTDHKNSGITLKQMSPRNHVNSFQCQGRGIKPQGSAGTKLIFKINHNSIGISMLLLLLFFVCLFVSNQVWYVKGSYLFLFSFFPKMISHFQKKAIFTWTHLSPKANSLWKFSTNLSKLVINLAENFGFRFINYPVLLKLWLLYGSTLKLLMSLSLQKPNLEPPSKHWDLQNIPHK